MKHLFWIVPVGLLLLLALWIGGTYNNLITLNERVDTEWAKVETQYQRRFDLIPGLVGSVQGAMSQEQKVFGDIAEARTKYAGAKSVDQKAEAATEVEGALSRLLVVMENYPVLQSNQAVQGLMVQLEGTENRISVARNDFNEVVQTYNVRVKRFPGNMIAGMFGFDARAFFQSANGADVAPKVEFNK